MLNFVLDYFLKYLVSGIIPDKDRAHSETISPNNDSNTEVELLLTSKRNMLEVMSDIMYLLQPELNIR
jgi:hypothetical protein